MLKSLVQLFAEKFLTSKKEWVGSQGLFSNPNPGTTFFVNHAQAQLYTPPSDGWITFGGHRSMSALPESWERVALTLKVISELQLRFGRGIPLVSIARRTISNRLRQNSFLAKGQRSTSLVGGASC